MAEELQRLVRHHVTYWNKQSRRTRARKDRDTCAFFARQCRDELSVLQSAGRAEPRALELHNGRFV